MAKAHEMDFTHGPLLKKIIIYALPIIGVNILQLLFSAADVTVLGIFTNDQAVAAVGATSQIVNLLIGFFVGLSIGANVLVARCVGAQDTERAKRLVGTSVIVSIMFGALIMIIGVVFAKQFLIWTNCDELVLPYATKYLRIYFLGMPIIMLYNFCAAILRAVGDTLRPLIFLAVGGVANIVLNIFFIVVVGLDVEGVAIATVSSQAISAIGALVIMVKNDGYAKLSRTSCKVYKKELGAIFSIGLPMGVSKCTFALANVILISAINALGDQVMTANSIAKEFDGFILEGLHGFSLAASAVISQNLGAKNLPRIKKTIFTTLGLISGVGIAMGAILLVLGRSLCGIMTDTELVVDYCMVRITTVGAIYVLCGIFSLVQESIRAIGYSNTALVLSLISNIGIRLVYIWFVYPLLYVEGDIKRNYALVCFVWPLSWVFFMIIGSIILAYLYRRVKNKLEIHETEKNYVKS